MSKVFIEESTLTAIGNAIRGKTGKSDLIAPLDMPSEITAIVSGGGSEECNGMHIPEEALVISGACNYKFSYNNWNWLINDYGNKITTNNIENASNMFYNSKALESIPFDMNFKNDSYYDYASVFVNCDNLKEIGKLVNMYPSSMTSIFSGCLRLRHLPVFENLKMDRIYTYQNCNLSYMFSQCYSLREIPEDLLVKLYTPLASTNTYRFLSGCFQYCYVLDEIKGVNPQSSVTATSNFFGAGFSNCSRVKDIIFATQEDGMPYSVSWKTQTIDLTKYVGYAQKDSFVLNYNSGITSDKQVKDDATYQALKDDADWYTLDMAYSRYNHDSAVNTINSLPDTSAYLASAGGTNTIKFKGTSGSATDGGAINTLTEEEIAVATAKGWTVSFV